MITIDGSEGEGGGQILRTSLALSLVTGQPFRMERIRAKRQKPGLLRQHLTAVEASKIVGCAEVEGAAMNSQTLEFRPGPVTPGNYRFAVGTAGSATLVLQTVLPSLLTAPDRSTLTLEGGTHNPLAPPFDFLTRSFMPLIHRMGPSVELELRRPGFYPAGGGRFHARIEPVKRLSKIALTERDAILRRRACVWLSKLAAEIADRELAVVREELRWREDECEVEVVPHPKGPGNALVLEIECEQVTAVFTGFGERGPDRIGHAEHEPHRIDVDQQRRRAPLLPRLRIKHDRLAERQLDAIQPRRILVQQIPEIRRRPVRRRNREEHGGVRAFLFAFCTWSRCNSLDFGD